MSSETVCRVTSPCLAESSFILAEASHTGLAALQGNWITDAIIVFLLHEIKFTLSPPKFATIDSIKTFGVSQSASKVLW